MEAVIFFFCVCVSVGQRVQMEMGSSEKAQWQQIQLAGNKAVLGSIAEDLHEEQ